MNLTSTSLDVDTYYVTNVNLKRRNFNRRKKKKNNNIYPLDTVEKEKVFSIFNFLSFQFRKFIF